MALRLLGLAQDSSRLAQLCGRAFTHYQASGVVISVVSLSGSRLAMEAAAQEAIAALEPQVVVADGAEPTLGEAVRSAFARSHQRTQRTRLPLKLYFTVPPPLTPMVTTMITRSGQEQPELFRRVHPRPWLSGILERDLFAGVQDEAPGAAQLRAS